MQFKQKHKQRHEENLGDVLKDVLINSYLNTIQKEHFKEKSFMFMNTRDIREEKQGPAL